MLMRGHGFNVVGDSIPSMVQAAIILRDNAVIQLAAIQVGRPKYLTAKEAKTSARALTATERSWNCYVARVRKAMSDYR